MNENKEMVKKEENAVEKKRDFLKVVPLVDIYENNDEILLHADMPGVKKEDITVNIDNGTLTLKGVRNSAKEGVTGSEELKNVEYERNFSIPKSIDVERVEAELKDGVLKLHLPKSEAAKPKMIEIKAA